MVPRDYWMTERIQRHKTRLGKLPVSLITTDNAPIKDRTEELNATKALQAVNQEKASLEEVVEQCTNLDDNR